MRSERETRERRERAREKARLKASERGRFLAFQNDRERNSAPARLLRLCFAKRPKGRSIFASPVGALCEKSPPMCPKESRCPNGRGAAAVGVCVGPALRLGYFRFAPIARRKRLSNSAFPRAEGLCERSPLKRANCALPLGAGALARALRFPNERDWDSHPRARFGCALIVPKVALACPIGRGSPFKVVSSCRRCVLRASQRTSRETGATRATRSPNTERGTFGSGGRATATPSRVL